MEKIGISIDVPLLAQLGEKVQGSLEAVELAIKDMVAMPEINLNSPRQVEDLLFNKLGLPPQKRARREQVIQPMLKFLRHYQRCMLSQGLLCNIGNWRSLKVPILMYCPHM
jgi:DNA polymerase I-like protein with 3'-5' exonuclease and polymerase domains